MWVLGKPGDLGIKELSNGHGDVTAVSTGPPPVMPLGIPHPGFGVVVWCALPHRSSFGALPSLLCSSVTKKRTKCHEAGFFYWAADFQESWNTTSNAPEHSGIPPGGDAVSKTGGLADTGPLGPVCGSVPVLESILFDRDR